MTKALTLGPGITLPLDAATESFAVLGQRGSGKSNAAVVFAEELTAAKVPWVAIDPKGDWWGVRSSADGKGPGLSVPVFGGLHGDVPLEPEAGIYLANLLVDENLTAVLDVSGFTAGQLVRFLPPFCHALFDRHRRDPQVRMVIFEEAHRYIPQNMGDIEGAPRLKEAAAKIPLEGRSFGLGSLVCSQRSSRLHKDVLTQAGTLVAMRSLAKLDRDAISGWVAEHGVAKELLASLASLADGEAWLWSPHFLGEPRRVRFRRRRTFDSGATPKVGQRQAEPRTLADVDLLAVTKAMADSIERAKAEDPTELRKQISALRRELAVAHSATTQLPVRVEVRVPFVPPEAIALVAQAVATFDDHIEDLRKWRGQLVGLADKLEADIDSGSVSRARSGEHRPDPDAPSPSVGKSQAGQSGTRHRPAAVPSTNGALPGPQRKLLTVLAVHGPRGRRQLAMQAGYSPRGGAFGNPLGALRTAGYVEPPRGEPITITPAGLAALGDYESLPTGPALLDWWLGSLTGPESKILVALINAGGEVDRSELAALAGYEPRGGAFGNPLGRLRTLELVTKGNPVRLTDDFAEAIS